ncbi:unnamed protein product [Didymodactylos carnosus]|uniref:Cytochrome P450 n=1 Tax=Didymodactylos carnosus TaxID=1234261 RepID=A0A8S2N1G7_9BILA|nr:unnamed protein product [Didymodactylos carnosus]CAF3981019.1 unnamed protein product [Didymodactylos carnosus]
MQERAAHVTNSYEFDRVASSAYQLNDYQLPAGQIIGVPIYPIHHDPKTWPNPEQFIPERFSADEKAKRHPMSFLPFGDGPRSCIGMRFALQEAKVAIVRALRVVEIERCEKTEIPLQLSKLSIMSAKNGIWLRVSRRSQ